MARVAATATVVNNQTGNHQGNTTVAGGESGHVYISYDTSFVTGSTQLRNLINAALVPLAATLKP